jgi:aspartyl-tRNA synthetase
MNYETVIGLEVHTELSTKTKIFCGCSTTFGGEPNSHTCPVCLGMPGSLPVLNREVVEKALRAGLALLCEIQTDNVFDRKNYFYPDLPKDYQISQLYHPICRNGWVEIDMGDYRKKIRIHEIHMEEDAGKLVHDAGASLVDYNRCGVPLIEIVSEPDLSSADEVAAYLDKLREILVYLDVSDCKMEEGSMRADVNLSVRDAGSEVYGTRTETKNMNSVKAIQRSIAFESARQIAALEAGGTIAQETRRWDDDKGENYAMRGKENAQDYRYFPDPDLVPLHIDEAWVARARKGLPELAEAKRLRYTGTWGVRSDTAVVLTAEKAVAELFEAVAAALGGGAEAAREAANVVTGDILRLVRETGADASRINAKGGVKIDPVKIARALTLVAEGAVNRASGRQIVEAVYREDADPDAYAAAHELAVIRDEGLIAETVTRVVADNPQSVADYKAGKEKAFGFLVGQSMKALKGKASPQETNARLKEALERAGVSVRLEASATGEKAPSFQSVKDSPSKSHKARSEAHERAADSAPLSADTAPNRAFDSVRVSVTPPQSTEVRESGRYRTYTCGDLRETHIGEKIRLAGWVHTIRDHGGVVFVDLRDQYGVTQVVVRAGDEDALRKESVLSVYGEVEGRDAETINPNIATGRVELKAETLETLGACARALPFEIETSTETKEELRLKYRYLDLRNPQVMRRMVLRSEIIRFLRAEMEGLGFMEVQTPILANSSPEGARDYLVPSRKHKGLFYALPQAPQQFKQLLMASGFDRYYQIAPCFRDEDARLDRSPGEFYQLDFEMAFATQEDVFAVAERVMTDTFKGFTDKPVTEPPYARIPYAEAMLKYGTDKPDLRNPLEIIDLSAFFADVDFAPFRGKIVRALRIPDAAKQPKSFFKSMEQFALSIGMQGLGYISVQEIAGDLPKYKGPIDKFFTDAQRQEVARLAALRPGDVLYFISDEPKIVAEFAGKIRTEVARRLGLVDEDRYDFCFITDYPMYEWNEDAGKIDFTHNPFSMPQGEMDALLTRDPEEILAWQYDIVCNGVELSSGAVRNHRPDVMVKAFEIAGYDERTVAEKFGALYSAFSYGAPPHAGMAPGVDRIVMLLSGEENIREIIPFPLNSNAQNLMIDAPSAVSEQQLREAHIKIR